MRAFQLLVACAALQWAAAQFPPGSSQACTAASGTLQSKMAVAQEKFLALNENCMEACDKMGDNTCTRDCANGISAYESACHSAGAEVLVVARRKYYKQASGPDTLSSTNFFICAAQQCLNSHDILELEAELSNVYCRAIPGATPPVKCFADVTPWPQVSSDCEAAYEKMTSTDSQVDAQKQYIQQNQACIDACSPSLGHSCDDTCLEGVDIYDKVCRQLPGQPLDYTLTAILPDNNGKTVRQMRTCVPNQCMANDQAAMAQRLEATTCDDFSVTEVKSCDVVLLSSDAGAVAAAVIFSILGVVGLGFAGFQVATRAGWVSKHSMPASVVSFCECGCCPRLSSTGPSKPETSGLAAGRPPAGQTGYTTLG